MSLDWVIVIPVKGTAQAKSRFGAGDNSALALAMALDTVEVALQLAPVIVVTDSAGFADLGATVLPDPGAGLNHAIAAGLESAGLRRARAVLLGDHPALSAAELGEVLAAAAAHPLSLVADAPGSGSALTAARPGVPHVPAFGAESRRAHEAAGYLSLDGDWPGLRQDVDTPADLAALRTRGLHSLGSRTAAALAP